MPSTRFSEYTELNHQTPLWIITALSLAYSILSFVARLSVKGRTVDLDDALLAVAFIAAFTQWILVFQAVHLGVGKDASLLTEAAMTQTRKLIFASRAFAVLCIGLSKCCIAAFLRQLFTRTNSRVWRGCTVLLGGLAAWTVASTLLIGIGTPTTCVVNPAASSKCGTDVTRITVLVAIDVCFEALLVIIPAYVFSTLQMDLTRKLTVVAAFAFRLGVAALLVAYLEIYKRFSQHGRASIGAVNTIVLLEVLVAYALVAATIPCLKNFLGGFRTGDLQALTDSQRAGYGSKTEYGSRSGTHVQGFALSSLNRDGKDLNRRVRSEFVELQPQEGTNSVRAYAVQAGDENNASIRSYGSDQMIIHKRVDVDVLRG